MVYVEELARIMICIFRYSPLQSQEGEQNKENFDLQFPLPLFLECKKLATFDWNIFWAKCKQTRKLAFERVSKVCIRCKTWLSFYPFPIS